MECSHKARPPDFSNRVILGKGYDLSMYDRFVRVATLMGSNRAYIDREIPHLEVLMVSSPEAALTAGGRFATRVRRFR